MHGTDTHTTLDPATPAAPLQASPQPSDAALIERSVRDPPAFAAVFDRHWPAIHSYCTSRAAAAGEDIAAEVFRRAFDHRRRYDREQPNARPWLYGIATNLLRNHFRTTQRGERAGRRAAALTALDAPDEPLGRLEAQLLGSRLAGALSSLAAIDREALLLLAWAELDYAEIARALAVPIGTVRSRIHRARRRVRDQIPMPSMPEEATDA